MLIYLLLAGFVTMLYWVYREFDNDIVCPNFLLVFGYLLSILCATANIQAWAIDLHWKTLGVLFYGTFLFVGTGYLVRNYMRKRYENVEIEATENCGEIIYNKKYVKWFLVFQVIVLVLWVGNIFYQTSLLGEYKTFAERMVAFRNWSSYSTNWVGSLSYNLTNQFRQISILGAYIALYILSYNFVCCNQHRNKKDSFLINIVVMAIIQILLTGERAAVVSIGVFILVLSLVSFRLFYGKTFELTSKRITIIIIVFLISVVFFYFSKILVGRGGGFSFDNFLAYMTMYAGGPIQLLDMFLESPPASCNVWGKETFYTLNNFFG